jgi:hypothetical protein
MLASQAVEVTTTGSNAQASSIVITAPLSWSNANGLALQAYQSIAIEAPVTVGSAAALTLSTYDGTLSFRDKGSVTFQSLASALTINNTAFTLVDSVTTLANAIASNPSGSYALANAYDASGDGTYTRPPVGTVFSGLFEGLGNAISSLTVNDPEADRNVGLFAQVSGAVRDVGLVDVNVAGGSSKSGSEDVGTLIGLLDTGGTVSGSFASGSVSAGSGGVSLGGLIGYSMGDVSLSHANVQVSDNTTQKSDIFAGGLIGSSLGTVERSFSAGPVASTGEGWFGGFVGENVEGTISNCYETGSVSSSSGEGGFAGATGDDSVIAESYAAGLVSGGAEGLTGGFVGQTQVAFSDDYWDVTTTKQNTGGGNGNVAGITGLTSNELRSGLPDGFTPGIWAQKRTLNKGFPYLIGNAP